MSAVRLLVLGIVRKYGQTHGYRVYRDIMTWRAETWASVKPGSVYSALKTLEREGMLSTVMVETSAEGPTRTIYRMNEAGETEFFRLLENALTDIELHIVGAGVALMDALPRARAIELLGQRLAQLVKMRDDLSDMLANYPQSGNPPQHRPLLTQWIMFFDSAARWTRDVIDGLESGENRTVFKGE